MAIDGNNEKFEMVRLGDGLREASRGVGGVASM